MKYSIYINDNTPCADRRPTFEEDLEIDLHSEIIEADNDEDVYKKAFLYLNNYENEEEFLDEYGYEQDEVDYKSMIEDADWGDGAPFIYRIVEKSDGRVLYEGCDEEDFYNECEYENLEEE